MEAPTELKYVIEDFRHYLKSNPGPDIIDLAKMIIGKYDRSLLPDDIECVANGDPEFVADVIAVALEDIKAEAMPQ